MAENETESDSSISYYMEEQYDKQGLLAHFNLIGYSSVFCTLGSQAKVDRKTFIKVVKTYPFEGVLIPKSYLFSFRIKGETEVGLKEFKLPHLPIFRPGLITNRRNDERFVETLMTWVPFMPKISARNIAKYMRIEAEIQSENPPSPAVIRYQNSQMQDTAKDEKLPENLSSS